MGGFLGPPPEKLLDGTPINNGAYAAMNCEADLFFKKRAPPLVIIFNLILLVNIFNSYIKVVIN